MESLFCRVICFFTCNVKGAILCGMESIDGIGVIELEEVTVLSLVQQALAEIIQQYGIANVALALMVSVGIWLLCHYSLPKGLSIWHTVILFTGVVYAAFVVELTLLTREAGSRVGTNLVFWGTYANEPWAKSYMIENLLMFIPYGILLAMILKRVKRVWICLLVCFVSSLGIEISQHVTARGYFQVDDIWLNVLGALVGYLVVVVVLGILKKVQSDI